MTALWTSQDADAATGGQSFAPWQANGISIDTRTLAPGDLFVALRDQRDGHDFVAQAFERGASAALVTHRPKGVDEHASILVVPDVLQALTKLAIAARARTDAVVCAVTGSVGKTSTKDMLQTALARQGAVHAAEKSYNNHWGVPLTLARMPQATKFAVIEIGMNHPGEIAPLSRTALPDVAMVTTVAAAHMAAFDDIAGIARAKAEIFDGLRPGGAAVLNADIETAGILVDVAGQAGARISTFGAADGADYQLVDAAMRDDITVVRALRRGTPFVFKIGGAGRHFAVNALAVLAAVEAMGADPDIAAIDLADWQPPDGRGTRFIIDLGRPGENLSLELIDDAFNANPASMEAALEVLGAAIPIDGIGRINKGRRIALLGDMLELGDEAAVIHEDMAAASPMACADVVHCVGPLMRQLHACLPVENRGEWFETAENLCERVHHLLDAGDVVLVKGSKGSRISLAAEVIRNLGPAVRKNRKGEG